MFAGFVQAPDWVDAEECHRCRVQFGVMTRKVGQAPLKLGHLEIFMVFQQSVAAVCVSVCTSRAEFDLDLCSLPSPAPLSSLRADFLWKVFVQVLHHSKVWHREGSASVRAVFRASEQVSVFGFFLD